jgi:hypothetical protein
MTLELAHRENDGIEFALLWDRDANSLTVAVTDARTDEAFEVPVGKERPLEVFHHPFAYANVDDYELAPAA